MQKRLRGLGLENQFPSVGENGSGGKAGGELA
jgi:hypothetical protein